MLGRGGMSRGAFAQPKPLWHSLASLVSARWREAGAHESEHIPLAVVSPASPHSFCLHTILAEGNFIISLSLLQALKFMEEAQM